MTQDDNTCGRCSVHFARVSLTVGLGESPPAAWALAVETLGQCRKGRGLWNCHDRFESERSAMGVVTIGDSSGGMTKYFDGRFRDVLIVVRRACLAKILEYPGLFFPGLDVRLRFDAGEAT